MADLAKLVDDLSSLTVLEAADLAKMLEEKWGVSAAAPVAAVAAAMLLIGADFGGMGGSGSSSQITTWVQANFTEVTIGGTTFYDLTQPASSSTTTTTDGASNV